MQPSAKDKHLRYKKTKCVLGEGSYKTVTKAIDEEEGKEVAYNEVKMKYCEDENQSVSSFSKEIALLKSVDHPNIIKIVDYWFSDDNFIFITEFMTGGSLKEYLQKHGPLSTKLIRKWGKQILEGLKYLHALDPPIIHRDIKNDNIFVNTAIGEVKIGDLGLARERKHKRYTIVGTPHFMAREMFEGEGYTEKIDIYAFGMGLIEMATGKTPYSEFKDTTEIYKNVLQGILPKAMQAISDPCLKSLVMGCIVPSSSRYTAAQCLDHHFFHPDVVCTGDCIPRECVAVYPLNGTPAKDMELSIVSIIDNIVVFQILLYVTMKFIKFEYDLNTDTVKKICDELIAEKIVGSDAVEAFSSLLVSGLKIVERKLSSGQVHDGIIEIDSGEAGKIRDTDMVVTTNAGREDSESLQSVNFGADTIEEMRIIEENIKITEAKKELEKRREEEITQKLKMKLQQKSTPLSEDNSMCSLELSKSAVKFKNDSMSQKELYADFTSEDIYSQFPNAPLPADVPCESSNVANSNGVSDALGSKLGDLKVSPTQKCRQQTECCPCYDEGAVCSPTRKQGLSGDVGTCSLQPSNRSEEPGIRSPPISSPPFGTTRLTEEQAVNDTSLNESYELCKIKYKNNFLISQYALDAASITGRTEDTAKSWIKALRDEDIETVFDLKLMVYEDWERLPLTVFSCRAMQNMLYGIDGVPPREKQLPLNPQLKEYDNKMSIKGFLVDVCETINRRGLVSSWEDRLLAQDIQTVGELKSLHNEDWSRLGLTVYAFRILKNVIFRKGKILIDDNR